jgi:hypothetical protein
MPDGAGAGARTVRVLVGRFTLDLGDLSGTRASFVEGSARTQQVPQSLRDVLDESPDHDASASSDPITRLANRAESATSDASAFTDAVERASRLLADAVSGRLDMKALNDYLDASLRLLGRLDREKRHEDVLRLARAISALLALALRWIELVRSLRMALRAAQALEGGAEGVAWASHELGTLHLAAERAKPADRCLTRARELREALGDRRGRAVTEQNMQALCRMIRDLVRTGRLSDKGSPAVDSSRRVRRRPLLLVAAIALLLGAGGAAGYAVASTLHHPTTHGRFRGGRGGGHHVAIKVTVTARVAPSGAGTVAASSSSAGAACSGGSCTVHRGGGVTLTARANPGYVLSGWSGSCAEVAGPVCTLTDVTGQETATAHFAQQTAATVTVTALASPADDGSVSADSTSAGAACSNGSCVIDAGGAVKLTAVANPGFGFSGWTSPCAGQSTPTCVVQDVSTDTRVIASFVPLIALSAAPDQPQSGSVSAKSSSPGASCSGGSCTLNSGGTVTFTATANPGFQFTGWSGLCQGQATTCTVSDATASDSMTASFGVNPP